MTMLGLLNVAKDLTNEIIGVYNVDIYTPDDITIMFINSNGYKYIIRYEIKSKRSVYGVVYVKSISYITCFTTDERFSELDYTQEELHNMLKKVNN